MKHLKTHEEFSNDVTKFFFMLDGKGNYVKTKGWRYSECWHNMIGKAKKSAKLRKHDSYHELPLLKSHDPCIVIKKTSSYEKTPSVECFSKTRFYSELIFLLSQGLEFIKKQHHTTSMKRKSAAKNMTLQKRMTDTNKDQ